MTRRCSHSRGGFIDFALASDDLAADTARLRVAGLAVEGPFEGSRRRPDGALLAWQTLQLAARSPQDETEASANLFAHHRDLWPFLIQWRTPDADRLAGDRTSPQPNSVSGVWAVSVIVRDLDAATAVYQIGLGLRLAERMVHEGLAAQRACLMISNGARLDLLAPIGEGPLARALAAQGEGLFSVLLATLDLAATAWYLAGAGVSTGPVPGRTDKLLIAPEAALGARLVVRAAS
jgi:hypothetical protein